MRGGGAGQGGVGVFWDKNGCLRLPAGVTPAGISLNHPGVNTQVFGLRYREGHTQLTGFFFFPFFLPGAAQPTSLNPSPQPEGSTAPV